MAMALPSPRGRGETEGRGQVSLKVRFRKDLEASEPRNIMSTQSYYVIKSMLSGSGGAEDKEKATFQRLE
jgi:hypothetical protein